MRDGLAHGLKHGERRVEVSLLTPDHDGQRGVDGALFPPGDGRVQHADALGAERLTHLLRNERRDRRHVEVEQPRLDSLDEPVPAEGHQLDVG